MKERHGGYEPTHARVRTNREFGVRSASKYDRVQPSLNERVFAIATSWTRRHYARMRAGVVMGEKEVVAAMDHNTSCGFPWNRVWHSKVPFIASAAYAAVGVAWEDLGRVVSAYTPFWNVTQKDEIRTREKVESGSLRTFTASAFEFSVSVNRLCLSQNEAFYELAEDPECFSQVGMSKFMRGWHNIITRLHGNPEEKRRGFSLDETSFDTSVFRRLLEAVYELRKDMHGSRLSTEDVIRLRNVYYHIIHSVMVLETGDVVQKHTGNPSGSSNTVVDNTIALTILLFYAFILGCEERGIDITYEETMRVIRAVMYGDDVTYTVPESYAWFDATFVSEVWTGLGVKTSPEVDEPQEARHLTFLSQSAVNINGLWLPSPDTTKILASLHVGGKRADVRWHYIRACALYMDSWANVECRVIIRGYIEYLEEKHSRELRGEVKSGETHISMATIRAMFQTDQFLMALYGGWQAGDASRGVTDSSGVDTALKFLQSQISFPDSERDYQFVQYCQMSSSKKKVTMKSAMRRPGKATRKKIAEIKQVGVHKSTKPATVKGHGDYKWKINDKPAGRAIGEAVGSLFGGVGSTVGGALGHAGHWLFKKITGHGDYKMRMEAFRKHMVDGEHAGKDGAVAAQIPHFANSKYGNWIEQTEPFAYVNGSSGFASTTYSGNPMSLALRWLSSEAMNYQEYQWDGLMFEYRPLSGDNATALGQVTMASQYNLDLPDYISSIEAQESALATQAAPNEYFYHGIECANSQGNGVKLVRNPCAVAPVPELYDAFKLQVITTGMPASAVGAVVGQIWVTYRVRFAKPTVSNPGLINTSTHCSGIYSNKTGGGANFPWGQTADGAPMCPVYGCPWISMGNSPDGLFNNSISFSKTGRYQVTMLAISQNAMTAGFGLSQGTGGGNSSSYYSNVSLTSQSNLCSAITGTQALLTVIVQVTLPGAYFTVLAPRTGTALEAITFDVRVSMVPLDSPFAVKSGLQLQSEAEERVQCEVRRQLLAAGSLKAAAPITSYYAQKVTTLDGAVTDVVQADYPVPPNAWPPAEAAADSTMAGTMYAEMRRRLSLGEVEDLGHLDVASVGHSPNGARAFTAEELHALQVMRSIPLALKERRSASSK